MYLEISNSMYIRTSTYNRNLRVSFTSNLKKPACASKRDVLELVTLRYMFCQIWDKKLQKQRVFNEIVFTTPKTSWFGDKMPSLAHENLAWHIGHFCNILSKKISSAFCLLNQKNMTKLHQNIQHILRICN